MVEFCGCKVAGEQMKLIALLFSFIVLIVGCAKPASSLLGQSDQSVIAGNPVQFKSEVGRATVAIEIVRLGEKDLICSGALISPHLIVTAAHCFEGSVIYEIKARFVDGSMRSGDSIRMLALRTDKYRGAHPPVDSYDIAILKLRNPAPLGAVPVKLDEWGLLPSGQENLLIAGGGIQSLDDKGSDGIIRWGYATFQGSHGRTEVQLKSGVQGQSMCVSDSGGPIFLRRRNELILWGIHKAGNANCTGSSATRIMPFINWLTGAIESIE
jgi:secreted trypsin-like serine protease